MQIGFLNQCCLNSYGKSVHANERKKEKCQDKKCNANRMKELAIFWSLITSNENDENVKEI